MLLVCSTYVSVTCMYCVLRRKPSHRNIRVVITIYVAMVTTG